MTTKTKTRKRRVDYRRAPRRMQRVPMEKEYNYFWSHQGKNALNIPILATELAISHHGEERSVTWHNFLIGKCESGWAPIDGKRVSGWKFTLHLETGMLHPTTKNRQYVFSRTLPTTEQLARYIPLLVNATANDVERLEKERQVEIQRIEKEHDRKTRPYDEERHPLYHLARWCDSEAQKLSYTYGRLIQIESFMTDTNLSYIQHTIDHWDEGCKNKYEPMRPFHEHGVLLPY